jgi:hypothetical protein
VLKGYLRYYAGPDYLEYGSDRIYGASIHSGDKKCGIPERNWLGF